MLERDTIFQWFCSLISLPEAEAAPWRALCDAVARMLEKRLIADPKPEMERLCLAASGIARCRWLLYQGQGGAAEEVRVGDITLKSSSGSAVQSDEEEYLRQIADLLVPEGFAFSAISEVAR